MLFIALSVVFITEFLILLHFLLSISLKTILLAFTFLFASSLLLTSAHTLMFFVSYFLVLKQTFHFFFNFPLKTTLSTSASASPFEAQAVLNAQLFFYAFLFHTK